MSARTTPASAAVAPPRTGPTDTAALDPRRWWALPVLLVGSFLSFLNVFIVNIALPAMRDDLGARPAELQFVVAGYGIGFSVFLITGGRLGDIFGRKRVFLLGLTGFTLASALCSLAATPALLIASRVLQALTAATLVPQVLAIIRVEFPAQERTARHRPLRHLDGVRLDRRATARGPPRHHGPVRLVVAPDLPGQHPDRPRRGRRGITDDPRIAPPHPSHAGSRRRRARSLGLFLLIYPLVEGREAGWPAWSFAMLLATLPVLLGFVCYEWHVMHRGGPPWWPYISSGWQRSHAASSCPSRFSAVWASSPSS